MKYLGRNLTRHVQDLYAKIYKRLMEEIKDLSRELYWIGRYNTVKMWVLFKLTYGFNAIPIKRTKIIFYKYRQIVLKFIWKGKGIRIIKTILKKKE